MNHYQNLSHTSWDCKYHLVWIPKCRKKVLFRDLRKYLGDVFRELALVGRDEETIRKYIKRQEEADNRIDQLKLFLSQ